MKAEGNFSQRVQQILETEGTETLFNCRSCRRPHHKGTVVCICGTPLGEISKQRWFVASELTPSRIAGRTAEPYQPLCGKQELIGVQHHQSGSLRTSHHLEGCSSHMTNNSDRWSKSTRSFLRQVYVGKTISRRSEAVGAPTSSIFGPVTEVRRKTGNNPEYAPAARLTKQTE